MRVRIHPHCRGATGYVAKPNILRSREQCKQTCLICIAEALPDMWPQAKYLRSREQSWKRNRICGRRLNVSESWNRSMKEKSRRDRDWESRNRRQTEWNTKFIWIFLRCEGGKPVKVNPPNRVVSRAACRNVFRYVRGGTRKSNVIA